jgi:hypothetical protein
MPSYISYIGREDEDLALGGLVVKLTATAALLYGDAVFSSATLSANKSVTAGDRLKRVGIVVPSTFANAVSVAALVTGGAAAAAAAGKVFVCYSGVAYAITGASAITAGMQVMFSAATAGRIIPATPTTDAGKIIGVALEDQATAATAVKILVSLA